MRMRRKKGPFDNYYKPGDWNVIDDLSGEKIKASEARMRWDNILTHRSRWEERHPQDYLRVQKDQQKVPVARSDDDPVFESTPVQASDL